MRLRALLFALLASLAAVLILSGCTATNMAANQPPTSQPTPPSPSPTPNPPPSPNPPPTPPPPTPPPTPPPATAFAFQVTLTSATQQTAAPAGELDINTDGNSRINFTGGTANSSYALTFCPFPFDPSTCQAIAAFNSDASGDLSATFQILKTGTFFGSWRVDHDATAAFLESWDDLRVGDKLQSNVYRVAEVTSGDPAAGNSGQVGTDPLTSGTVTVTGSGDTSNGPLHIVLKGAAAATTYDVGACTIGGGSGCYQVGHVTTDANGDLDTTLSIWSQGFEVITFSRIENEVGYNEFVAAVRVE